jgi:hypothetical protein
MCAYRQIHEWKKRENAQGKPAIAKKPHSVSILTEEDNEWKKILPIFFCSFFLCESALTVYIRIMDR